MTEQKRTTFLLQQSLLQEIQRDESVYYKVKDAERKKEEMFLEKYGTKEDEREEK